MVEGDGRGKYGRFKKDKTGPISQFMVDNVTLYALVKKHIVKCPHCDPTEAVRHYLERRRTDPKFKGRVTGALAKVALSYERQCAKTRPVPRELVNEFIWRSGDRDLILANDNRMSVRELVEAARFYTEDMMRFQNLPTQAMIDKLPKASRFGMVCQLLVHKAAPETDQELEDLIQVAEVTLA